MPQKNNEDPSQQARATAFSALSGELAGAEIGGFLSFLFGHVAYRPDVLLLLETAAAVRFLQTLAWKGVPAELIGGQRGSADDTRSDDSEETREGRRLLQRLAQVIWGNLFQYGDFRGCGEQKAKAFLQRHSKTYLVSLDVTRALEVIEELEIPADAGQHIRPPHLMSLTMSAQGQGNPRLGDDVSERIYTAYHALKRARVKKIRPRIAEALSQEGVSGGRRRSKARGWDWSGVHDRIKRYDRGLRQRFEKEAGKNNVAEKVRGWREHLVYRWVSQFHLQQQLSGNPAPRDAKGSASGKPASSGI